ncbi:MAG: hemolysin [Chlamydiales bacterium]|jgi:hypothetical protein|nr:hemolysin [Chlamydiales bacterium]
MVAVYSPDPCTKAAALAVYASCEAYELYQMGNPTAADYGKAAARIGFLGMVAFCNPWTGVIGNPRNVAPAANAGAGSQNAAAQTSQAGAASAAKGGSGAASKGKFPENPADLMPDLPRDQKGHIYPSDNLRIRPEKHPMQPGETYNPRHHGQHYHVETRKGPSGSWKNDNKVIIKPKDYEPGQGTGFLPGEDFP